MTTEFSERRRTPRTDLKQMVRIRPFDPHLPPEYCTTFNVSPTGLYFATSAAHYALGMRVYVTSEVQPGSPLQREASGAVVRIDQMDGDQFGVALQLFNSV
jgi:hypothetical protein